MFAKKRASQPDEYYRPVEGVWNDPGNDSKEDVPTATQQTVTSTHTSPAKEKTVMAGETSTCISVHSVMQGNYQTDDDLVIYGQVLGNVTCNANLKIYGKVEGEIICNTLFAQGAQLTGNVSCTEGATLQQACDLTGDLSCYSAYISGVITGNVVSKGIVTLDETACVNGDIKTGEIIIGKGAVFNGSVQMTEKENPPAQPEVPHTTPSPVEDTLSDGQPAVSGEVGASTYGTLDWGKSSAV